MPEPDLFTDVIGYVAGFILAICFLPQVIKTFRLKHANDVSLWMLILNFMAAILYEVYAWRLGLMPVVIMNGIFGGLVLTVIALKLRYDLRKSR